MNIEEAEYLIILVKKIKDLKYIPDRIIKAKKEGRHDDVANLAIQLSNDLLFEYERELSKYPSKLK